MIRYQLVSERSEFSIEGRSSLHPLHAATNAVEGYLELETLPDGKPDPNKNAKGRLEVDIANLKSGNFLEDREVHRRVDTKRYPKITVTLLELRELEAQRHYQLVGDVMFRGLTRRIQGTMKLTHLDDETLEANGTIPLDSRDFGLETPKIMGLKVFSEFTAKLKVFAKRAN